ncbi:MAG: alpha/beta hydrolase [Planctomycetaceae bacterium]
MADKRNEKQSWKSHLWGMTKVGVLTYVFVVIFLMLFETTLVYPGAFTSNDVGPSPRVGSDVMTVDYAATDGVPLQGRLLERANAKRTVLFFHGNGEKAIWLDGWAAQLSELFDANVMLAEYRGFNEDDATPNEAGLVADAKGARDFLCDRYNIEPDDLILYGRSLGGGCVAAVAEDGGAKAIVLERTFDRLVNVAAGRYWFVPVKLVMRNRFDSVTRLSDYTGRVVQVHGTTDRLIPIEHAQRLFDSIPSDDKHWIPVEGLGHNDVLPQDLMSQLVEAVTRNREEPE